MEARMLAANLSRRGVERLSFFQDPITTRDTWQQRSTYFQNGAVWVGLLSMIPVFLSHYVSQWWTVGGFATACALYGGSEKCSGRAADWTLRADAFNCAQSGSELGVELERLRRELVDLKRAPSSSFFAPITRWLASTPTQIHPLKESASNRDQDWQKACDDLVAVAGEVGRSELFTERLAPRYRGALLYTLQQTVAALQSVGKSPEDGGQWDLFLGRKLQLAYLLSWMKREEFELREDHPRGRELVTWELITRSLEDTAQSRANLISFYTANLKQFYLGKKPSRPEFEKAKS